MPMKRMIGAAALSIAMLVGSGLTIQPTQAAYIVTLAQVGPNVIANGNGSIDTERADGSSECSGKARLRSR
jgi:hypothetical protein